mmetsp:Transcript_11620/g.17975  ORF Transcript_11620/g.17975 Transcript_11620/m.17975 type:complete len:864 (-) Transcript_11620:84-2675(-)
MSTSESTTYAVGFAFTFSLLRLSVDLISTATKTETKKEKELLEGKSKNNEIKEKKNMNAKEAAPLLSKTTQYGSVNEGADEEGQSSSLHQKEGQQQNFGFISVVSLVLHGISFLYLVIASIYVSHHEESAIYGSYLLAVAAGFVSVGITLCLRDYHRERFGWIQRSLYVLGSFVAFVGCLVPFLAEESNSAIDQITVVVLLSYFTLSLVESKVLPFPRLTTSTEQNTEGVKQKAQLSRAAIFTLLKPYFWPHATSRSAALNRTLAILTWVFVIAAKFCNIASPIFLGWASTALAHQDYALCIKYSIAYSVIQFFSSAFKEAQSLVYLKVAQAAFVQLSEVTFHHLHSLSLDWHLRKKLGEVIRSMDRGIAACDTLMKYMFLWLVPALAECLVVCIIFISYFDYLPLAVSVFYFVFAYIVWTILVTLWRKKYRKAVVKSDNEWHDRCTDSLVNFETVKYFTAETYEMNRFGESVQKYQSGSVDVAASLSFLNISQKMILTACLGTSLSLAALGIQKKAECCLENGCESSLDGCCSEMTSCSGMEVGDFVAVLTYTLQLFAPLNFLGSVYNAIVMAIIDLNNLSELLAEDPDVIDAPDALPLPSTNGDDPNIAVEFDNVLFHYPTQSDTKGLKGLSFKMKRGTTTAIVGPTGAGKTTISRLFFRFYDVLGGAVKVNGVDVRTVTQKSLRAAIGVVPQTTNMFNDTLRANILYGRRDATQEELEKAVEDAQLTDFVQSLDEGWESMVGDRGLKLSGGEQQRTSIARCLLKDPPFVVLDEATSALDTITENSVQEALDSLGSERTVLIIAHRLGTIRNADNIVVLKDGQVEEQGTHDELLELNGMYADMWNMQLHSTGGSSSNLSQL